jgi:hypothetical protein
MGSLCTLLTFFVSKPGAAATAESRLVIQYSKLGSATIYSLITKFEVAGNSWDPACNFGKLLSDFSGRDRDQIWLPGVVVIVTQQSLEFVVNCFGKDEEFQLLFF